MPPSLPMPPNQPALTLVFVFMVVLLEVNGLVKDRLAARRDALRGGMRSGLDQAIYRPWRGNAANHQVLVEIKFFHRGYSWLDFVSMCRIAVEEPRELLALNNVSALQKNARDQGKLTMAFEGIRRLE